MEMISILYLLDNLALQVFLFQELSVKGDFNVNTKDRSMNAKVEADVFAKKSQKLVAEYKASAKKEKDSYSANDNLHIQSKV